MILPILIVGSLLIALGFILTPNNAKYLLSGYNMMKEEDRKKMEILPFIAFFKKFHLALGFILLVGGFLLNHYIGEGVASIFLVGFLLLAYAYFIYRTRHFYRAITKAQKQMPKLAIAFLIIVLLLVVALFIYGYQSNAISVHKEKMNISGMYGREIPFSEIKSVTRLDTLPAISSRTNGFAVGEVKKGKFTLKDGTKALLFIQDRSTPILKIETTDRPIFIANKNRNLDSIYRVINNRMNNLP